MRKFIISFFLLGSGYGAVFTHFLLFPGRGSDNPVVVTQGMPFKNVASMLEQEGVIRNRFHFRTLATVLLATKKIEAGEYLFSRAMRPLRVLIMLIRGDVIKYTLIIPEGITLREIAFLLASEGLADGNAFIAKAADPDFMRSLDLQGKTLEGYLFPETYKLKKGMPPEDILMDFVEKFKKEFTPEMERTAQESGMTQYQILILASIIEKEAKRPEERPLISAVFHNRLKMGMPLQADPTVIYGLGGLEAIHGKLRRSHLKSQTPYNTYIHRGLPPGPIGNPGLSSILAALHPAPVPYLYFVSRNDGSHAFSSRLTEHNRHVYKFQRSRRRKDAS